MSRPALIGITPCTDARGRWRRGHTYHYVAAAYARAVEHAGGCALYLPTQSRVADLIERVDGLLIPGGDDLPPPGSHPAAAELELTPPEQLDFDRSLVRAALERGIPLLGICYGAQLLALEAGGELTYHLPTDRPDADPHRLAESARHPLRVEPDSHLARRLDPLPEAVNSQHHQAILAPGDGMRVCARAGDGVIEAIERRAGPLCLGVQWHPEKLEGPGGAPLFRLLVEACDSRD